MSIRTYFELDFFTNEESSDLSDQYFDGDGKSVDQV